MQKHRRFNYDEFLSGFRAACARWGVDPETGATSYQVIHIRVDLARAAHQPDLWWQRHEIWQGSLLHRNALEEGVIWDLFLDTYIPRMTRFASMVALRNARLVLRELYRNAEEREVGQ